MSQTPRPAVVLRAADIARLASPFVQQLDPGGGAFDLLGLSRRAGLARARVSFGRIPPGGRSFAYHSHVADDEWLLILSGRARARIDGQQIDLGPGDFVGFPAPQVAHQLSNAGEEDLLYVFGGDDHPVDVLDYPDLGKRFALVPDGDRTAFLEVGASSHPFGRAAPSEPPPPFTVFSIPGWGSAIVEAALAVAGLPWKRVALDPDGADRDRLLAFNPLGQLPTAVLPDGTVMTESAAIVLHLADLAPGRLAPLPGNPARAPFLRWLTFLAATVYPTFGYGDDPARWVGEGDAKKALRTSTDSKRLDLLRQVDAAASPQGPWFLGDSFSAVDLFLAVMTRWRPGRARLAEVAPRLVTLAERVDARPDLAEVWQVNFP